MPFTQAQEQAVKTALGSKIVNPCPSCGQQRRQLLPDLVLFPTRQTPFRSHGMQEAAGGSNRNWPGGPPPLGLPGYFPPQQASLPCVAVVCGNCGYTEFYNVHILGIAETIGVPAPGVPFY